MKKKLKHTSKPEVDFVQLQSSARIKTLSKKISQERTFLHADLDMFFLCC
jgi:hypothetical protein